MKKLSTLKESDIQTMILNWLNLNKIFAFRVNTTGVYDPVKNVYRKLGKFSLKGVSDIIGILPDGRLLAIEVKVKKGKPTMEQLAFIDKINKNNGKAFIARSVQDVADELRVYL